MPTVSQAAYFNLQVVATDGTLAANHRLYTYSPSTTTKKVAYTDAAGSIAHTYTSDGMGGEYIALDARGELPAPLYLQFGGYDLVLKTGTGASVWTRRAIGIGDDAADLSDTTSVSKGDALIGVKRDASGSVARTQHEKNADFVSVKDFGATGDGSTDDTAAIQAAIDSVVLAGTIYFPQGVYRITSTLNILGNTRNLTLYGDNGIRSIPPGGAQIDTVSELLWDGATDSVMLLLDSTEGTQIERLCFRTKSTQQETIDISVVTGIRLINKSSCRFSTISECGFYLLNQGVHFFDDGTNASSDTNMDGHRIRGCHFYCCVQGVLVNQTNVYDTPISSCSFYGATTHTKHHVWIQKGHVSIYDAYLGVLKNGASVGGKNGIAVYIQQGWVQVINSYAENHNGPFLVWESAEPVSGSTVNVINCTVLGATADLPTEYQLRNDTNNNVNIFGGSMSFGAAGHNVEQLAGTTGTIYWAGGGPCNATAASEADRVVYVGARRNDRVGAFGSVPNGTSGGGKATIQGYGTELKCLNLTDDQEFTISYTGNTVSFDEPGNAAGPKIAFAAAPDNEFVLSDAEMSLKLGGNANSHLRYVAATANGTAATTLGSVGPAGATAGNPVGWLRISVAGDARYVPFW